jgi:peptide deformylase
MAGPYARVVTIRKIAAVGHPVLRQLAREVSPTELADPATQRLIDDLIDTMRDAHGAGIAAPQVHESVRIAVVEVDRNPRYPYKPPIPLTVLVNPVWEPVGADTVVINEGCLSVPLRGDLRRHVQIRVRWLDRDGRPHTEVKRGLTAGTFQHEIDHLDGTLVVDRIDSRTLSTWDQFDRYGRASFVARITAFTAEVGS